MVVSIWINLCVKLFSFLFCIVVLNMFTNHTFFYVLTTFGSSQLIELQSISFIQFTCDFLKHKYHSYESIICGCRKSDIWIHLKMPWWYTHILKLSILFNKYQRMKSFIRKSSLNSSLLHINILVVRDMYIDQWNDILFWKYH